MVGVGYFNVIRNGGFLIFVEQQGTCCRQLTTMHALTVIQQGALASADVYSPEVTLQGAQLVRGDNHRLILQVKA